MGCLIGSFINIPLLKLKTKISMVHDDYVIWFGVTYRIPKVESPIAAAVASFILMPSQPRTIAYVVGTLGTLICADLLKLKKSPNLALQ